MAFVMLWIGMALFSVAAVAVEMGVRMYWTADWAYLEPTRLAVEQFVPPMIAGVLLTVVLVRNAPEKPGVCCRACGRFCSAWASSHRRGCCPGRSLRWRDSTCSQASSSSSGPRADCRSSPGAWACRLPWANSRRRRFFIGLWSDADERNSPTTLRRPTHRSPTRGWNA